MTRAAFPTFQSFCRRCSCRTEIGNFKSISAVASYFPGLVPHALGVLMVGGIAACSPASFAGPAMGIAIVLVVIVKVGRQVADVCLGDFGEFRRKRDRFQFFGLPVIHDQVIELLFFRGEAYFAG